MVESKLTTEHEIKERIKERKLLVHKVVINLQTAKNLVKRNKIGFFAKLGVLKPKPEEIECESVQLFYEPSLVAKANYFLDYYQKKTYTIKIRDTVSEVIVFGQTLKPRVVKKRVRGIRKLPRKEVAFEAQERGTYKATAHVALNRTGREIDPTKLPSAPAEPEPEKVLKESGDKARRLKISPDTIIDIVRKRIVKKPSDLGRIAKEMFEVTEYAVVYTPIYEARCRHLKTGEIRIIPVSGVTSKMLSL